MPAHEIRSSVAALDAVRRQALVRLHVGQEAVHVAAADDRKGGDCVRREQEWTDPWESGAPKALGQPIIVDNKPGAGNTLGADVVAKKAPDGYTFLVNAAGVISNGMIKNALP